MSDDESGNYGGTGGTAQVNLVVSTPSVGDGSGVRINMQPPDLNKFASYEDFKDRIDLWKLTTDIDAKRMGLVLANSLPDISKRYGNNIATALLKKHPAADLFVDGGLQKVIGFLDNKLGKTKVLSQINAFAGIDRYNRQSDQGIVQFIAEFDLRYNTCVAAGIKLPTSVVAYMLLFRAELDHTQYQLIKGVIDLNKESEIDNLYEKVKEKMRDMLTDSLGKVVSELNITSKVESDQAAFVAEHEEVFAAWKNKKQGGWKPNYQNRDSKYNASGAKPKFNSFKPKSATNPVDSQGRTLKCRNCEHGII